MKRAAGAARAAWRRRRPGCCKGPSPGLPLQPRSFRQSSGRAFPPPRKKGRQKKADAVHQNRYEIIQNRESMVWTTPYSLFLSPSRSTTLLRYGARRLSLWRALSASVGPTLDILSGDFWHVFQTKKARRFWHSAPSTESRRVRTETTQPFRHWIDQSRRSASCRWPLSRR
jgi:hypothetical protein